MSGSTPDLLNQNLCFNKLLKWLIYTLNCESHWLGKAVGERDTEPCSSSAMALLDIGPAPTSKITSPGEGWRNQGWGMLELFTPTMPPPGDGVEVLFLWSYRSKHFPANTNVQVPGLRFQRPGLWSPPFAGFPDYEHLPLQFLYTKKQSD